MGLETAASGSRRHTVEFREGSTDNLTVRSSEAVRVVRASAAHAVAVGSRAATRRLNGKEQNGGYESTL